MNDRDRNRYEALKRVAQFKTDNAASFPSGPAPVDVKATALFATVATANANIAAGLLGRTSATAGFHAGTVSQATKRDGLMLELLELNRAAAALAAADRTPELLEHFRMPHAAEDAVLAAQARAMKVKAGTMSGRFLELGFAADFVTALETRIVEFEAAGAGQDAALATQVGHTASFGPLLEPGLVAVKQLDVICRQKFKTNAQKLNEWLAASHTERLEGSGGSGGGSTPPPPPPPPPPVLPTAPQNVTVQPGGSGSGAVEVGAEPPPAGQNVTSFNLYDADGILVAGTATLPVVVAGFTPGAAVTLTVRAVNAAGEGPASEPVTGTAG